MFCKDLQHTNLQRIYTFRYEFLPPSFVQKS